MKKTLSTLTLITAASAMTLSAQVYDGFDYTVGNLNVANGSGGTGWSGGWYGNSGLSFAGEASADVVTKTWSTPTGYGFTPIGNAAQNDQVSTNVPYRQLGAGNTIDFGADGTYYFSFLFNKANSNNAAFNFGIGNSSAGAGSASPYAGIQLGAGGSGNGVQPISSDGTAKTSAFTAGLTLGTDLLVLGRLTTFAGASNDTIAFNIYTSADTLPGTDPGTFTYALGSSAQSGIADRITLGASATGNDFTGNIATDAIWDEFRLGTSWNAVAVPEPSSYALLAGMLALASVMIRRRK